MDIITVTAGVLIGNLITAALLWQLRAVSVPEPPVKNLIILLLIFGLMILIGLGLAQSYTDASSGPRP